MEITQTGLQQLPTHCNQLRNVQFGGEFGAQRHHGPITRCPRLESGGLEGFLFLSDSAFHSVTSLRRQQLVLAGSAGGEGGWREQRCWIWGGEGPGSQSHWCSCPSSGRGQYLPAQQAEGWEPLIADTPRNPGQSQESESSGGAGACETGGKWRGLRWKRKDGFRQLRRIQMEFISTFPV